MPWPQYERTTEQPRSFASLLMDVPARTKRHRQREKHLMRRQRHRHNNKGGMT
jgi:hypothetical protein